MELLLSIFNDDGALPVIFTMAVSIILPFVIYVIIKKNMSSKS